jgi:hypothetical protein
MGYSWMPPPTHLPPGPSKVDVLAERAENRQALFHPDDAPHDDRSGISQAEQREARRRRRRGITSGYFRNRKIG